MGSAVAFMLIAVTIVSAEFMNKAHCFRSLQLTGKEDVYSIRENGALTDTIYIPMLLESTAATRRL
jgi:hypothetical protein